MNKEEITKLVFETLSKIAGFKIKPNKEFYVVGNGIKVKYYIDRDLMLWYRVNKEYYKNNTLQYRLLLKLLIDDDYQLEEIKEPLLTDGEKEFLRQVKFEELAISTLLYVHIYNKSKVIAAIHLNNINLRFDGLKVNKRYSREELGL